MMNFSKPAYVDKFYMQHLVTASGDPNVIIPHVHKTTKEPASPLILEHCAGADASKVWM
jgi:hypothetical protein